MGDDDHVDAQEYFFKKMMKNAHYNKMGNHQSNNHNHQKHGMYDMYDMKNSDMDFSDMFHSRHSRAVASNLDLGDRLVEKLKGQQQEMEEKVGNLTCILQEEEHTIQENFGPLKDILSQSGLTENQLFPLVQNLLHGQES